MMRFETQFIAIVDEEKVDNGLHWISDPEVGDIYQEEDCPDFEITKVVFVNEDNKTAEVEGIFV